MSSCPELVCALERGLTAGVLPLLTLVTLAEVYPIGRLDIGGATHGLPHKDGTPYHWYGLGSTFRSSLLYLSRSLIVVM